MSITSARTIGITFSGEQQYSIVDSRLNVSNTTSPGVNELKALTTGTNTITVPAAGTVPTAVTIIPPTGNTNAMTLKGASGDTGVPLHKTVPSSVSLDTTASAILVTCAAPINVRFIWT